MRRFRILVLGSVLAALSASMPAQARTGGASSCRASESGTFVTAADGVRIHVRTVGRGRPILMIPSLGRGADDFDALAAALARKGYMSVLPDPRMTGRSSATPPTDLFTLAQDNAAVIEALCHGPVDVVGHAYGNRVARALATSSPSLVARVALLAGGGEVEMRPEIRRALAGSFAQDTRSDADRLPDLQLAFFAKGNDPSVWLRGWYPAAAEAQVAADRRTETSRWWTAGKAPLLLVQAAEDPVAPAGNAVKLAQDVGTRLTQLDLRHASHAILPEQPKAVAAALAAYFKGRATQASLQRLLDRNTHVPPGQ